MDELGDRPEDDEVIPLSSIANIFDDPANGYNSFQMNYADDAAAVFPTFIDKVEVLWPTEKFYNSEKVLDIIGGKYTIEFDDFDK